MTQAKRVYYFAANIYEGCGHKHKTLETARVCLKRMQQRGFKGRTFRVTSDNKAVVA